MKELIWEGVFDGKAAQLHVESEGNTLICSLTPLTEGFLTDLIGGAVSFSKAHPFITGAMAGWAWDSIKKYNDAKKYALKFYAKDFSEQSKYWKMVKELEKTGSYRLVTHGYKGGAGYYWGLNKT